MFGKWTVGLVLGLLAAPCVAGAATLSLTPTPSDLSDLDHTRAYRWGFDVSLAPGEAVIHAELSFENIRNWDNGENDLYIHLLDWTEKGVRTVYDNEGGGDYFANQYTGTHHHLETYSDLPTTPQDITYTFTAADLAVLNAYLADSRVGIGFDADCHYYNDGVRLSLITPEPATLGLLGAMIPVIGLRRRGR